MKKHIAKILRTIAEEKTDLLDKSGVKKKYRQLKKSWKHNVKNGVQSTNI